MKLLGKICSVLILGSQFAVASVDFAIPTETEKWELVKELVRNNAVPSLTDGLLKKVVYPGAGAFLAVACGLEVFFNYSGFESEVGELIKYFTTSESYNLIKCLRHAVLIGLFSLCAANVVSNRALLFSNKKLRLAANSSLVEILLGMREDCLPVEVVGLINEYRASGSSDKEKLVEGVTALVAVH